MNDAFNFSDKTVLVTGSSRGIGAGIVTAFARLGARCARGSLRSTAILIMATDRPAGLGHPAYKKAVL
ncbi:MAG TPA: hypothetical protein VFR76_05780 [Verrucomicrobiae bacterium]|nr:hypothetical protein [Verrucomicrobiae bacterium]